MDPECAGNTWESAGNSVHSHTGNNARAGNGTTDWERADVCAVLSSD